MGHRNLPEVSMGSMADIAFLLLIFFLVATTMETDQGIMRRLPRLDGEAPITEHHNRNVMVILVNRENQIMVEGNPCDIINLRERTREFILNSEDNEDLPLRELIDFPGYGAA